MLLIGPLPVSNQPALCQENEQIERIETNSNRCLPGIPDDFGLVL